ncbi:MAG: hypothetical protein H6721_15680 [Sandaracinus sp.]|nr:hypothetical protein [Sandaracinus sp.]MCB9616179.1 hypothetical protein [Sandaracinus sp.]MCB9618065.1 hypothetical protein [Sandaracinus sp.]MCB9624083.1 hypothetical protein [Sandaracinus sp.]MCB9633557.1 hypothetical protein [Sandaracinus sp.]
MLERRSREGRHFASFAEACVVLTLVSALVPRAPASARAAHAFVACASELRAGDSCAACVGLHGIVHASCEVTRDAAHVALTLTDPPGRFEAVVCLDPEEPCDRSFLVWPNERPSTLVSACASVLGVGRSACAALAL